MADHPDALQKSAVVRYPRPQKQTGDLNLVKGDHITDITKGKWKGWLIGKDSRGRTGYFPENHVVFHSGQHEAQPQAQPQAQQSSSDEKYYMDNSSQHFHFNGDVTINSTSNTANIDASTTETTRTEIHDATTATNLTTSTTITHLGTSHARDWLQFGFSTVLGGISRLLRLLCLPDALAKPLAYLIVFGVPMSLWWSAPWSYLPWPFSLLSSFFWTLFQALSSLVSLLGFGSTADPQVTSAGSATKTSSSWGSGFWGGRTTSSGPVVDGSGGAHDDSGFGQHNSWIVNTDLTRMGDFNMYHDTAHSAWELAVELESQPDGQGGWSLITLQLNGQLISTSLEVAKDNIKFTETQHEQLVDAFLKMIKMDRREAKLMHEALQRQNSSVKAAQSLDDNAPGTQDGVLGVLCLIKALLPSSWCYEPPPPIKAREILATRLQQWDTSLKRFMQSRVRLLGGLLRDTDGSKGPSNTCKAKRDTNRILDEHEKGSWTVSKRNKKKKGNNDDQENEDEDEERGGSSSTDVLLVITPEEKTSLHVLNAKSQLICDWHREILDWGNDKRALVEDEIAWIEKARKRLDNNWVDAEDDRKDGGIMGDSEIDDAEIRRVEGLIKTQALEWIQQLKEHWERLY